MSSSQLPVVTEPRTVFEFEYRDELVRFQVSTHRGGRTFMDIRTWFRPSPGEQWRATRKGFHHNVEALEDWQAGIASVAAAVDGTERHSSSWSDEPGEAA